MSTKVPDNQTNNPSPADDPGLTDVFSPATDPEAGSGDPGPGATGLEHVVLPRTEAENERQRKMAWLNDRLEELLPHERAWMERYHTLLEQGFQLRPRLRPGWQPSWTGPGGNAIQREDGEVLRVSSCFGPVLIVGS